MFPLGAAVHRYSASDEPITLGDRRLPLGPILSRGTIRVGSGIAVDELQVTVSAGGAVQVNGMPLLRFITGGGLDGARGAGAGLQRRAGRAVGGDGDLKDGAKRARVVREALTWLVPSITITPR
jgi:hypothetical protein